MCRKNHFAWARLEIAASFLAAFLAAAPAQSTSTAELPDSTNAVASPPSTGPINQHKPYISRATLKAEESAATMTFEVALKMRNFADLKQRVEKGEHVPLPEMAAKYEPLASDYKTVLDWLKSEGFSIVHQDSHHMAIFVRGSVSQIARAFKVTFARVTSKGREYTSAVTTPSVPANIAPLLIGINGLQPHLHPHTHLVKPNASGGGAAYTPAQIAQAYQASGLYSTNLTGAGQTIAIVIDTFPAKSDLLAFWNGYGIDQSLNNITFIQVIAGALDAASGEETLDTEWSSAIAPAAKVRVYATTTLENPSYLDMAYEQVYDDATNNPSLGIHQMSMSYGAGDLDDTTIAQRQTDNGYFVSLVNAGVTCFASSGDEGPTPDIEEDDSTVQVESPASDPDVIGVGGTTLTTYTNPTATTEVVWGDGASGGASGGGTSTSASTTPYLNRPTWQAGTGVPTGSQRLVPDIACAADPNYGADIYYTDPTDGLEAVIGGTSWASPTCAGFCALINQARANVGLQAIGQGAGLKMGALIYPLIGTANFRDITSGNNDTSGNNGYSAGTGYDKCTGVGVPLVQTLAKTLANTSTLIGVGQASPIVTVNQGQNATITVTATGSPVSYQWQVMTAGSTTWSSLSDGTIYSGSATATLTVLDATTGLSGAQYQCEVTYAGSQVVTSNQATTLIVENPWTTSTFVGTSAGFDYPADIAVDSSGNLYVADVYNNVIHKVTSTGTVTTPYGSKTAASTDGTGTGASFDLPRDIAIDSTSSNLYVSDEGSGEIRKINISSGQVSTISSSASPAFNDPKGICVDSSNNVYVADSENNVIRKIAASTGKVTIIAGSSGFIAGFANGPATNGALFNEPIGLAIDHSGNLYVTEYNNQVVREISSSGTVSTFAGQPGIAGCQDGPAASALFNVPRGIMVDGSGNVYVTDSYAPLPDYSASDTGNNLLREISSSGVVTTLAGQPGVGGTADGTGDGAQFYNPIGLAMNASGEIYLADASNNTIRLVQPATTVSIVATDPTANAFSQAQGLFTVTRTGSTTSSLTVSYAIAGTAVANTDYTALPGSLTIPTGSTSAAIMVDPMVDTAVTSPTVQLTLDTSASYTLGTPSTATVTIQEPTSFQSWQLAEFGSNAANLSSASATAVSNHVGLPNFLEYALNATPPTLSTVQDDSNNNYVAITYTQLNTDPDLTYTVQVTSDLTQQTDTWHSGSSYTTSVSQVANPGGSTTVVTVRDNTPVTPTTMRFIRVQVSGD